MELKPFGTLPLPDAKRLSASRFVWEKFCGKQSIATSEFIDGAYTHLQPGWELVGWCPSAELKVRMRAEGVAILVHNEEEGYEVWGHIISEKYPIKECWFLNNSFDKPETFDILPS